MKSVEDIHRHIIARTKEARETRTPYSQEQMADLLGIPQGRYKHYETRTPLPHAFIGTLLHDNRRDAFVAVRGARGRTEGNPRASPKTPLRVVSEASPEITRAGSNSPVHLYWHALWRGLQQRSPLFLGTESP